MDSDPTYTLWHPTLITENSQSQIGINITPGAYDKMPSGPKSFFENLLDDIGLKATVETWEILTYRSNYQGLRDKKADWMEKWPINWRIKITLVNKTKDLSFVTNEYFESYAYSSDPSYHLHDKDKMEKTTCLIISDFNENANLIKTQNKIENSELLKEMRKSLHTTQIPNFYVVNIGDTFFQLQIFLGQFPDSFYSEGAEYAKAVEKICLEGHGITSFEKRTDEWDEWDKLYD